MTTASKRQRTQRVIGRLRRYLQLQGQQPADEKARRELARESKNFLLSAARELDDLIEIERRAADHHEEET
jgi:hypothetical protein